MDTSQFGQDTGGDDIFFDEQLSDEDPEDAAEDADEPASGNLNRRNNNVTKNYMEDITDTDDSGTEEDE